MQIRARGSGEDAVAGAVVFVVGDESRAQRPGCDVDAVGGDVHADAFVDEAAPAGVVVVGHGAGAGGAGLVKWWGGVRGRGCEGGGERGEG